MYKANYKQVKWLINSDWSQEVRDIFGDYQPHMVEQAYYTPSQANWSYVIGITWLDGKCYELVTRFGSVEGGRELQAEHYNQWNTERKG
jgi:hypothetical protein